MLHKPAVVSGIDEAAGYKKRLGLWMLAIYGVIYVFFIVINVAWPKVMGKIVVAGLNLAIVYGFALILIAFVLALVYNIMCTRQENAVNSERKA